jgi:guanylate kinase
VELHFAGGPIHEDRMTTTEPGYLFVYLGTSKSGRVEIAKTAAEKFGLNKVVKYASRGRKPGDVDGVSQHFMTPEEFQEAQATGKFVAVTKNDKGDLYGVTREQIDTAIANGQSAYLTIPNPMDDLLSAYEGRIVRLFTYTSREEYEALLASSGESQQSIEEKLAFYDRKMGVSSSCDHVFRNDNIENTVGQVSQTLGRYIAH